ncbi:hypothetical protein [Paenibacillus sp. RC67]|uniref:hypothetical protein n=1 Tax=Paenibacillus sp. RC67 TaxID=3039392 RepID=UPI0024ADA5DF|nr:hypothetical protein [Paenibacillus sp. RC67]
MRTEWKQTVESIIREILLSMQGDTVKPPKVLYVFCDSTAHEAFTDHFILLANHGICHDILFLDGETSSWLGLHKIECGGRGKIITSDEFAPAPLEVPLEYDGIVIPEIDLDNAGKAAAGLKGTVKSELILSALLLNKFVFIGDDVPGIKRADRRTLQTLTLPKPYQTLFDRYKKELQTLGVEFAPQKHLAERVVSQCSNRSKEKIIVVEAAVPTFQKAAVEENKNVGNEQNDTVEGSGTITFEGRLMSADWVQQQVRNGTVVSIVINKRTLVSPLARDLLKATGVELHYADQG